MRLEFGAYSHRGKVREKNEDSYYVPSCKYNVDGLFMVADGMGGHNAGEVASKMMIREIADYFRQHYVDISKEDDIRNLMLDSVRRANKIVYDFSMTEEKYEGMGTTLTMAYFFEGKLRISHVGDSRAYIIRNDTIDQITRDHSLVQELLENGSITMEEVDSHPQRNVITRALGTDEDVKIDYYEEELLENDIVLLCTDGLINHVNIEEIKNLTVDSESLSDLAKILIVKALDDGGTDNITVIVAKYNEMAEEG